LSVRVGNDTNQSLGNSLATGAAGSDQHRKEGRAWREHERSAAPSSRAPSPPASPPVRQARGSASTNASKKVSGKISIAYLQKQGDQQYFIDEAQGAKAKAKAKAKQLGDVDVKVVNLGNDTNKAVSPPGSRT
jgi:hypothetical protein